jgi:putative Mg2+ transporter-C (MgtC) family protein
MLTELEILERLAIAAALGAAVGFEREWSHKVAGLRTHSLVAIGAALFSLITIFLFERYPSVGGVTGLDYHLIANVVVGIGFIGAGAILRRGSHVIGTTTAATLWLVAAVGLAVGLGFIYGALIATGIGYLVLTAFWQFEKRLTGKSPYDHYDHFEETGERIDKEEVS